MERKDKAIKALNDAKGMRDALDVYKGNSRYEEAVAEANNIIEVLESYVGLILSIERITKGY